MILNFKLSRSASFDVTLVALSYQGCTKALAEGLSQ
jgi:hypothetical protein